MNQLRNKIKTHRIGNTYQQPHFFILNKGNNAGKPMANWCPNCFVFLADDDKEHTHFFTLCKALWVGHYFKPLLIGSVIPFIHIDKFTMALHHANISISAQPQKLVRIIHYFNELDQQEQHLKKQFQLIQQLRLAMAHKFIIPK